ncbi:putative 115 kDa protein in type-1 retrotransposable element R1DM [Lucilia cuprina]|nr:putative 115 kDa protein in type-1 retrotransposable element R1DM [Lucilia cuprina]
MQKENENVTVQGLITPVPAALVGVQTGSQSSKSGYRNTSPVANLAGEVDNATSSHDTNPFGNSTKTMRTPPPAAAAASTTEEKNDIYEDIQRLKMLQSEEKRAFIEMGKSLSIINSVAGPANNIHKPIKEHLVCVMKLYQQLRELRDAIAMNPIKTHIIEKNVPTTTQYSQTDCQTQPSDKNVSTSAKYSQTDHLIQSNESTPKQANNTVECEHAQINDPAPKLAKNTVETRRKRFPSTSPRNEKLPKRPKTTNTPTVVNTNEEKNVVNLNDWTKVKTYKSRKKVKNKEIYPKDTGEALTIKTNDTKTYAEMLKQMKNKINPMDIGVEINEMRRTKNGELLIKLKRGEGHAEKLKEVLKNTLGNDIMIRSATKTIYVDIRDMDESTEEVEIIDALKKNLDLQNEAPFKILNIRESYGKTKQALVQMPVNFASRLIAERRIKIGWIRCRIRQKENPTKCFRCLDQGHLARDCTGIDRTDVCMKCCETGHKAKDCNENPRCSLCQEAGVGNFQHFIGKESYNITMIKFIQVNLGKGRHAQDLLLHKLSESYIDLALISEQYKRTDAQMWFEDSTKHAAILTMNRSLNIREVCEENESFTYVTINGIRIYSCYFPPSMDIEKFNENLNKLDTSIRTARARVIIGGDFNSKSPEWNSKTLDRRGKLVSELIASLGLIVFNNGNCPTFIGGRGSSIIDITFGSPDLCNQAMEWKVLDDLTLSDHQYITFNIDRRNIAQHVELNLPRWNVRKINIKKFKNRMLQIKQITNLNNIEVPNIVNQMTEIITKCCNDSMPKASEYNKKKRPAFWWNSEIKGLRIECLHARRMATRNHSDDTLLEMYKNLRKKLRTAIKQSKKKKWIELCSSIDDDPWGKPYKIITKKLYLNKPIPGITQPAWVAKIVSTLFPKDIQGETCSSKLQTEHNFVPFNIEELNNACKKLKTGKSPGPDGIPNEALALTGHFWPELLLGTYNSCFRNGFFPKCWKTQNLVLLRKGTKPLNQPNSYRPLCMINTLGKLYESLLFSRLNDEIKRLGGLSPKQYGFQKGKSTIVAIKEVTDIATASKRAKGFCIIVTLDVKNAFNTVKWNVVLDACKSRGINAFLYNTVADYLHDRVLMYKTDVGNKEYRITAGVPQGSVLGPLLWNIMYDGLLNLKFPKEAHIIGYADDVALVISHTLPRALEIIANDSLNRCDRWLYEHGLKLAAEKTEAVLITDRRVFKLPEIRVQGRNVTFSQNLRYLGLQLDSKLSFSVHLQLIRDKALQTANTLARIMPNIHGPKDSTRKLINSVILSQMLYAAPIFSSAIMRKCSTNQLLRPQRLSAIRIISAYRTVSTSAALVLSGIPPIDLLILEREEIWYGLNTNPDGEYSIQHIKLVKEDARNNLMTKWQERWQSDETGRWTHKLIPNIQNWINRKHGRMHYYLTQILTGHGNFNRYLAKYKIKENSYCEDCGSAEDNAEHVLFHCPRWNENRRFLNVAIGTTLTPENMVHEMLKSKSSWKRCDDFISRRGNRTTINKPFTLMKCESGTGVERGSNRGATS